MAGHGGRRPGSGRKHRPIPLAANSTVQFVDRVFRSWQDKLGLEGDPEENLTVELLASPAHQGKVWERLMDYKYGRPVNRVESSHVDSHRTLELDNLVNPHLLPEKPVRKASVPKVVN
jgi:hypothetical protein